MHYSTYVHCQVPSADRDPTGSPENGAPATENVEVQSKQKRKSALAAREGSNDDNSQADAAVGAYVHISRVSDKRMDRLEKAYKPGQKVCSALESDPPCSNSQNISIPYTVFPDAFRFAVFYFSLVISIGRSTLDSALVFS